MNARDMVETMTERDAKMFLLSLLAATLNAVDASDTGRKHAVKCLEMTAARFGILEQMRKESANFDAREAAWR